MSLEVLAPDVVVGVLIPLVLNASADELPNVRLAAARALSTMVPTLHEALGLGATPTADAAGADGAAAAEQSSGRGSGSGSGHAELERCLVRLATDRDYDIIHFAKVALKAMGHESTPQAPVPAAAGAGPAPASGPGLDVSSVATDATAAAGSADGTDGATAVGSDGPSSTGDAP